MMIMSDLSALMGIASGFARDARFSADQPVPVPKATPDDPLADAFAAGFTSGHAEAQAKAEQQAAEDAAAKERLALAFAKLDATLAEELNQRLHDTVAALCEAAIAPLALDREALESRVRRAVTMLARADDERVIRLNPEDIAFLAPVLSEDWTLREDASLQRGALRVECANGGVEDGPEQWRQAIAEALRSC